MNFFQFDIGNDAAATSHISLVEDAIPGADGGHNKRAVRELAHDSANGGTKPLPAPSKPRKSEAA